METSGTVRIGEGGGAVEQQTMGPVIYLIASVGLLGEIMDEVYTVADSVRHGTVLGRNRHNGSQVLHTSCGDTTYGGTRAW